MVISKQLFFPFFGLLDLRRERGERWMELVDWISTLDRTDPHVIAFTLTVRRLRNEIGVGVCGNAFCAVCAAEMVRSYRGSESDLIAMYWANVAEVKDTLRAMEARSRRVRAVA